MEGSGVYKYKDRHGGSALYRGTFVNNRFEGEGICRASGNPNPNPDPNSRLSFDGRQLTHFLFLRGVGRSVGRSVEQMDLYTRAASLRAGVMARGRCCSRTATSTTARG